MSGTGTVEDARTAWLRALDGLWTVPGPHRDECVTRDQALLSLRCGEEVLDELLDHGLPHAGEPPGELYERSDVINLGLASGTLRSMAELGALFLVKLGNARSPDEWVRPMTWRLAGNLLPLHGRACGERPSWRFRRPQPGELGGTLHRWETEGADRLEDGVHVWEDAPAAGARGLVETRGERREVRSPAIRELFREMLRFGFRSLPPSLEADSESVARMGAGDCVAISLLAERECRRAGYEARSRRGYLLGLMGIGDHSWVEVVDDDGLVKIVDPVLVTVARHVARAGEGPSSEFESFCLGSVNNRILPFGCPAPERIAAHSCGGSDAPAHAAIWVERDD